MNDSDHQATDPRPDRAQPPPKPRRRRWRRWALAAGITTLALFLALAVGIWWVVSFEAGARWLVTRVGALTPGTFTVESLEGRVRGPFAAHQVSWHHDAFRVDIERLELEWRLGALWKRQLDVHRLHARGVRIWLAPSEEEEPAQLVDINLRFNVLLRSLILEDLELLRGKDSEPLVVERLELETADLGPKLAISRLDVVSPHIDLDLAGTLEPVGDYAVDLSLGWALRLPEGPELAGRGTLGGTLRRLEVTQELSAPFPARVVAILHDPLYDLSFDAEVELRDFDPRLFAPEAPELVASGMVSGTGTLESFSASGALALDVAEIGPADAAFHVTRRGERWEVERLELTRPGTETSLEVRGEILAEPLGFDLTSTWRELAWPLEGEAAVTSGTGGLRLEGTPESYRIDLDAQVGAPASGLAPGRWRLEGDGSQQGLTIRSLLGETLEGALSGHGEVAWEPELTWRFAGTAEGLDPSALGLAIPPELGAGSSWRFSARGGGESAVIEALDGELLDGTLRITGRLAWEPELSWEAEARGSDLDPGRAWPGWSGRLDLVAQSVGASGAAGLEGTASLQHFEGTLRGRPLAARAELALAGERILVSPLEATWGGAQLSAKGDAGETLDLDFEVVGLELAAVVDDAGGEISARGRFRGERTTPRLQASLAAVGLHLGDLAAARIEAETDLDLSPGALLSLELTARDVSAAGQWLDRLSISLHGTQEDHQLRADAEGPDLTLETAARGAWDETLWRGALGTLQLDSPAAGRWQLESPVTIEAGADQIRVAELCWLSPPSRLCADVDWAGGGTLAARATLEGLPLSLFEPWLPPDAVLEGALDGSMTATGNEEGRLEGELVLTPQPGTRFGPRGDERPIALELTGGSLHAWLDAEGARARLDLALTDGGSIAGEAALPGWAPGVSLDEQSLTGAFRAEIRELGFLEALAEGISGVAGRLEADLDLAGTAADPTTGGVLRLTGGRASLAELGLELEEIRVTLQGDGTRPLALEGSLRSGAGSARLAGQVPLTPTPEQPLRIALQGQRLTASDTRELRLLVSPDLTVVHDGTRMEVEGQVEIPSATLELARPAREALQPSRWEVFVAGTPPDREPPGADLHVRLRLVLGDSVRVAGLGLDTQVRGSLLLLDEPDRPTRASGELQLVGGTFQAYGQDLTIEQGRLLFAGGPVANPGLRVRAYRQARDGVRAGVEARGTLEVPEVTLWSEPPMSQSDALAYLLLGRPLETTTEGETDYLAQAATALGLRGGALLAERLGARWGLEEAAIETGNGLEEAALVLGKYLSPRLYVSYGIGLFDPVSTFRVRYRLSDRWTLQGQSGIASSGDLLYTIDRGGPPPAHPPLSWPRPEDLEATPLPEDGAREDGP